MGSSVCKLVKDCFTNPALIGTINDTMITLIPKGDAVVTMKDFRPIGLCNVSYKIITKLLGRRLRALMEDLVSPHQCSFVPNRHSSDNIIIAQEVIHSMRSKKGAKGWMAIKIDLEKAYDRLNWDFVKHTLQDIGLPQSYIDLVWYCISTPWMRVIWNGEALEEFTPSRGSARVTIYPLTCSSFVWRYYLSLSKLLLTKSFGNPLDLRQVALSCLI